MCSEPLLYGHTCDLVRFSFISNIEVSGLFIFAQSAKIVLLLVLLFLIVYRMHVVATAQVVCRLLEMPFHKFSHLLGTSSAFQTTGSAVWLLDGQGRPSGTPSVPRQPHLLFPFTSLLVGLSRALAPGVLSMFFATANEEVAATE